MTDTLTAPESAAPLAVAFESLSRKVATMEERLEDLEDLRDLNEAIGRNVAKPLTNWSDAKSLLELD